MILFVWADPLWTIPSAAAKARCRGLTKAPPWTILDQSGPVASHAISDMLLALGIPRRGPNLINPSQKPAARRVGNSAPFFKQAGIGEVPKPMAGDFLWMPKPMAWGIMNAKTHGWRSTLVQGTILPVELAAPNVPI